MRHLVWCVCLVAACATLPHGVPRLESFDARRLEGEWYVHATNFPNWLDGTRTDPRFHYRVRGREILDQVSYVEAGRRETIDGIDTQDPEMPSHFTWRGVGWLRMFTSDWVIVAAGPDDRWLVLYFTSTLATPEGVDVIARAPEMSAEDRAAITRLIWEDPFLASRSSHLTWIRE